MQDKSDRQRKRSGYRQLIGYRTKAWREGYGEVELIVGPQHLNSVGIVHGGVYASMLDVAMGHAVSYCTVPGNFRFSTTVSLAMNFIKAARGSVLTNFALIDGLLAGGASVSAYDPKAMPAARALLGDRVTLCPRSYDAAEGADALILVTEWNEFREPDFARVKALMRRPAIFDGRNLYNPRHLRELGFHYEGIGRR